MLKIGLTGGIGTGKTTVAKIFEALGVPVYYADDKAKEIMQKNPDIIRQIKLLFGAEAYQNNRLNTNYISSMVFENKDMLSKLEAIVHPVVRKDFLDWVTKQKTDCVMVENAILYKSGMDKLVDLIIMVTADDKVRMERLKKRDGKSEKVLKKIIDNQKSEQKLYKSVNFFIRNNKGVQYLHNKIESILLKIEKNDKCLIFHKKNKI